MKNPLQGSTFARRHRTGIFPILPACTFMLILVIFTSFFTPDSVSAQHSETEYKVKAAMIYKFISFIQWPDKALVDLTDPVVLCVVGENLFEDSFDEVVAQKVEGREFAVINADIPLPGKHLENCEILFIPSSVNKDATRRILDSLSGKSVLTIGEREGFLEMGGMMNFVEEGGRVRFEINAVSAGNSDIEIRSRLLKIAVRVVGE